MSQPCWHRGADNNKEWYAWELRYDGTRYFQNTRRWGTGTVVTGPIPRETPHYTSTLWDGRTYTMYTMDPRKSPDNDELDIVTNGPSVEYYYKKGQMISHECPGHELLDFLYGDYDWRRPCQ